MRTAKLFGVEAFVAEPAAGANVFVVAAAGGLYLVEQGEGASLSSRGFVCQRGDGFASQLRPSP